METNKKMYSFWYDSKDICPEKSGDEKQLEINLKKVTSYQGKVEIIYKVY